MREYLWQGDFSYPANLLEQPIPLPLTYTDEQYKSSPQKIWCIPYITINKLISVASYLLILLKLYTTAIWQLIADLNR